MISAEVPRIHEIEIDDRKVRTVSLTAPSGAANRAIGSMKNFKQQKAHNPDYTTFDYRVEQYAPFF